RNLDRNQASCDRAVGLLFDLRDEAVDGQNRRAVDDQTPPRPYPRILSRSFLVTRRPSSLRGMLDQISFSRKSRAWAIPRFPGPRLAIFSLRSSNARRIVAVLDSPVICASSSASRSTLSF